MMVEDHALLCWPREACCYSELLVAVVVVYDRVVETNLQKKKTYKYDQEL